MVARAAVLLLVALGACADYTAEGGEFYGAIARAACSSYERCGDVAPADFDMCVSVQERLMCERNPSACASPVTILAAEWHACLDALESIDCGQLRAGVLPAECASLDALF